MITRAHNRSRLALTFFPLLVVTALLLPSAPIRVRGDDPKLSPEMIKALENVARFSKKEVFIVMAEDVEGESLATVVHYVRRKKLLGPIRKPRGGTKVGDKRKAGTPFIIKLPIKPKSNTPKGWQEAAVDFFSDKSSADQIGVGGVFSDLQFQMLIRALEKADAIPVVTGSSVIPPNGESVFMDIGSPVSGGEPGIKTRFVDTNIIIRDSQSSAVTGVLKEDIHLKALRRTFDLQVSVTTRFLSVGDSATEEIGVDFDYTPVSDISLERGFGRVIGDELRRTLLSSIEGASFTGPRIDHSIGTNYNFGPNLKIGQTPFGDFDNEWLTTEITTNLYFDECDKLDGTPFVSLYGGGGNGLSEKKGSSNVPGTLTDIRGINPALTPVGAWRNRALSLDTYHLGTTIGVLRQCQKHDGISPWMGLNLEHTKNEYNLREQVAGAPAGPFFSHALDLEQETTFLSPKFGLNLSKSFNRCTVTAGIWTAPGFQFYELQAAQNGPALPLGRAQDKKNGFAIKAGLNLGYSYSISDRANFNAMMWYRFNGHDPDIRYPDAGGTLLRADTDYGHDLGASVGISIRFGSSLPVVHPSTSYRF